MLNAWHSQRPVHCEMGDQDAYLYALTQLEEDGFSHLVFHHHNLIKDWEDIRESFHGIRPSYSDDFVSIYRLSALRDSCPSELSARHRFTQVYADALQRPSMLDNRHGALVILPPTPEVGDHLMRYLHHFSEVDRTVVVITWDQQAIINIHTLEFADPNASINPEQYNAVWLVNDSRQFDAERSAAYQHWFLPRFKFCKRHFEDGTTTFDLYLRKDFPCSAMDETGAKEVRYDNGVLLHSAFYEVDTDLLRFFLAWTNDTSTEYGFSLQFYDDGGNRALQYDNVIWRHLLNVHEIDTTALPPGDYSVLLILYDFGTRKSQSGTLNDSGKRFEREIEIARIQR